ncbi:PilZ domain-containing protein [Methylomagnum sp.]
MEYDEKRKFARVLADGPVRYRLAGSGAYCEGSCLNISGSGISFRGGLPLAIGKAAELNLFPENHIIPPLTAYIEVVRCEPGENGDYRIAGAIQGIKSE